MWDRLSLTTSFLFLASIVAVAFRFFWQVSVVPDDEDRFTKFASFLVFLTLSAIVLWFLTAR